MKKITTILVAIIITLSTVPLSSAQSNVEQRNGQLKNFLTNLDAEKCFSHDTENILNPDTVTIRAELYCLALKSIEVSETDLPSLSELRKIKLINPIPRSLLPYYAEIKNRNLDAKRDPSQTVGTAEAIDLLLRIWDITIPRANKKTKKIYVDLIPTSTFGPALQKALDLNIISPQSDKRIGVKSKIKRVEVLNLLFKLSLIHDQEDILIQPINIGTSQASSTTPGLDVLLEILELLQTRSLYQERFDIQQAMYDAIKAVVGSIDDRYSVFFTPAENEIFHESLEGELQGIGAYVDEENGITVIVSPLKGSPAEAAGLQAKDQVIKVNGEDVVGQSLQSVVSKIKGPAGTEVILTIKRATRIFDVPIIRAKIEVPAVTIEYPKTNIPVFQLTQFNSVALKQMKEAIEEAKTKETLGIIIDLRNNPGGFLHIVLEMLEFFTTPETPLVQTISTDGKSITLATDQPIIPVEWKIVVLTNKGSASASEIFAASIQEHNLGTVIGDTSFGKGTVQELRDFYDKSAIKITIAEWLSGKGNKIDGIGVIPDFQVTDLTSTEKDEQLERAILEISR
jgi:carboxyl-terminal processing protease